MIHPARLVLPACLALAPVAASQTLTVTTLNDGVDFAAPQTAAQLPGPDGKVSFREACTAANNTPGPQTIAFAIPQSEWWLIPGIALLRQESGLFVLSDDATTVDFTTQEDFTGVTNPGGHSVGVYGLEPNAWGAPSIWISGNDCLIRGLDRVLQRGHAIQIAGDGNRVQGCTISGPLYSAVYITGGFGGPPASSNVVGGAGPGEGNVLSSGNDGVRIDAPAVGNLVLGNTLSGTFHGVAVRGSQYTTTADGNRIGGPAPGEGNVIAGAGKYGEEGFPTGSQVSVEWATGTVIEGNVIGTTPDGLASANSKGPAGVALASHADGTVIRGNVISGIVVPGAPPHYAGQTFGVGIELGNGSTNSIVEGNLIGTDATGLAPLPNHTGVADNAFVSAGAASGVRLGGTGPGQANVIAFNDLAGVRLSTPVSGVTISGNSIHSNGGLGIDLGPTGVTPNDPLDGDAGANGLQNAPLLLGAAAGPAGLLVVGGLDSVPGADFVVEVCASADCDPSGAGEGAQFLGAVPVTTDAAGHASFSASLGAAGGLPVLSATATRAGTGDTSEFSTCLETGPWTDLGLGKPGSAGTPALVAAGMLTPGSANGLALAGAAPSAAATLVFGGSELGVPFKGGTLVPVPLGLVALATDASGALLLPFAWPAGVPVGTVLVLQAWIADGSAPAGLSASNGLRGVSG